MIPRQIADSMQNAFHKYPVITVTGPRQSGKTTLCRYIFEGRQIVYNTRIFNNFFYGENDETNNFTRYRTINN